MRESKVFCDGCKKEIFNDDKIELMFVKNFLKNNNHGVYDFHDTNCLDDWMKNTNIGGIQK